MIRIDETKTIGDVPAPLRDLHLRLAEAAITYPGRTAALAITITSAAEGPDIYITLCDLDSQDVIDEWDYSPGPAASPEQIIRRIVWFVCLSIFNAVVEPQ